MANGGLTLAAGQIAQSIARGIRGSRQRVLEEEERQRRRELEEAQLGFARERLALQRSGAEFQRQRALAEQERRARLEEARTEEQRTRLQLADIDSRIQAKTNELNAAARAGLVDETSRIEAELQNLMSARSQLTGVELPTATAVPGEEAPTPVAVRIAERAARERSEKETEEARTESEKLVGSLSNPVIRSKNLDEAIPALAVSLRDIVRREKQVAPGPEATDPASQAALGRIMAVLPSLVDAEFSRAKTAAQVRSARARVEAINRALQQLGQQEEVQVSLIPQETITQLEQAQLEFIDRASQEEIERQRQQSEQNLSRVQQEAFARRAGALQAQEQFGPPPGTTGQPDVTQPQAQLSQEQLRVAEGLLQERAGEIAQSIGAGKSSLGQERAKLMNDLQKATRSGDLVSAAAWTALIQQIDRQIAASTGQAPSPAQAAPTQQQAPPQPLQRPFIPSVGAPVSGNVSPDLGVISPLAR